MTPHHRMAWMAALAVALGTGVCAAQAAPGAIGAARPSIDARYAAAARTATGTRDPYTDGMRTISDQRDPFTDGSRSLSAPRDPYSEGGN